MNCAKVGCFFDTAESTQLFEKEETELMGYALIAFALVFVG